MKIKKRKTALIHSPKAKLRRVLEQTSAQNPYGPSWATLTGLRTPWGEVDAKTSIGYPEPVLMFPNQAAFRADIAGLATMRGTSVELLGWIDRAGFEKFVREHHLDPSGLIMIGVEYLNSVKERPL
jgi:hypothetical protein